MNYQLLTFLTCGFSLLLSTLTAASPPAELSTQDWMTLQEKIHTSVYQFKKADGIYTAYNAKQQLQARITQRAVQMRSRQANWQFGLSLSAYGYGDQLKTVEAGRTVITERGLESQHPGITEWYINNERGLRQNFTLNQPPAQTGAAMLRVALHVNGSLTPQLAGEQKTIQLNNQNGETVLHYGGLYVYDAEEQSLPAHFALANRQIVIEVDDSQAHYPVTIDPLFYTEQAKLTANDGQEGDWFGISVALDGDTMLVGAPWDDDKGSVYVFVHNGTDWLLEDKLTASDGGDWFGISVALKGDTALVGAPWDHDKSGSAYVFVRNGTIWSQQAKLTASDGAIGDRFANAVALDGNTALIGAYWDDDKGYNSGSAYVFVRSGDEWSEQAKLIASDGAVEDNFARSVALNGDTVLVGAPGDTHNIDDDDRKNDQINSGSAYVFVRSGTTWSEQAKLTASDRSKEEEFGISVALDGDTALIGTYGDEEPVNTNSFLLPSLAELDIAKLDMAELEKALENTSNGVDYYFGSAYVFERIGTTWEEKAKLRGEAVEVTKWWTSIDDHVKKDAFGISLALDGDIALVGAWMRDKKGAAYIFVNNGTTWDQMAKVTASDGAEDDFFGAAVALSGSTVLVGAYKDDDNGTDSGSAYVFMPQTVQFSSASYTVNENVGTTTFTVSRTHGNNGAITVEYASSDDTATAGSDYLASSGTLSWGDGDADDKTFDIDIIDDTENESNETFIVSLGLPTDVLLGSPDTAVLTIIDNENIQNSIIIDFGEGTAIKAYLNNETWTSLHSLSADSMVTGDLDGNGQDDLIVDFGDSHGIQVRMNNSSWIPLHNQSAHSMVTGDLDNNGQHDVIIDFGDRYGVWVWMNNSSWAQLHNISADSMVTGDLDNNGQHDVIIDFGDSYGVWVWMNNSSWVQLHKLSVDSMVTGDLDNNGLDELILDFGDSYGVWVWMNNSNWVKLHNLSADSMVTGDLDNNGLDEVILDFGEIYGIWVRMNNSSWVKLHHNLSADSMVTGDLDNNGLDDVTIDFGDPHGIWVRMNNSSWVQLESQSAKSMVIGNID